MKSGSSESLPKPFIAAVFAILSASVGINLVFAGKPWLDQFNMFCWIGAPIVVVCTLLLYLFNPTVRNLLTKNTIQIHPLSSGVQREGLRRIPQSAVRPEIVGESCNARVSAKSTNYKLQIVPLWHFHAIATLLTVCLVTGLILTATIDSVSPHDPEFSALLPTNGLLQIFASIPPGFKVFIGLFGVAGLILLLNSLRKPQRRIELDRTEQSCTITHQWLFGTIQRFNRQISLNDIEALQLISYTDKEATRLYVTQTGKRGFTPKRATREYELNLVMSDGSRINIVNHRYKKGILRVTTRLHDWLGTPVTGQI